MTLKDLHIIGWVKNQHVVRLSLNIVALYIAYHIGLAIYHAFFGPLRKIPGPIIRALTNIPEIITQARGNEPQVMLALHEKYGPIVRISPNRLSFAGGARAWKDIYGFKRPSHTPPTKWYGFYSKPYNNVDNLVSARDDYTHTRQRKLVSHAFADKTLKELEPLLKAWCGKLVTKLGEKAAAGETVDILKYYNCTTFDIMGDLTFSESLNMLEDGEYSEWVKMIYGGIKGGALFGAVRKINRFADWFVKKFLLRSHYLRVQSARHWNYSKERVDRRLSKNPERPDLWTKILAKSEGPDGLTREGHYSNASLFMIAGTETTATALSGVTYNLLQNPKYLAALTKEIRDNFATFDDLNLDALQQSKYLHAVLLEGMRIYPSVPTWMPREVPKGGLVLDGQFVAENTIVGVHQLSTYRANFTDPYDFKPERWLGDSRFKDDQLDAFEPFSVGPRNCIGKNLAWHEMRLILATMLLHFDLELCAESENWPDQKVFILWEKKPLFCRLTPVRP